MDYGFTGQRSEEATLGSLYDYGARFYSPYLNRWIQPDTIVPSPGNPQSLNRFSYVSNNPLKYVDPTGHMDACPDNSCGIPGTWKPPPPAPFIPTPVPAPTPPQVATPMPSSLARPPMLSQPSSQTPKGRFLGVTSKGWAIVGIVFDGTAAMGNGVAAFWADAGLIVPSILGHPEIGLAVYDGVVVVYQAASYVPNSLSTAGWVCTVFSGIASGENKISYDQNRLSISLSQDTLHGAIFTLAGWAVREPNVGTLADTWVVFYDVGRVTDNLPAFINPTLTIEPHQVRFTWNP